MSQQVYSLTMVSNVGGQFCTSTTHWLFEDSAYSSTQQAALALCNAWLTAHKAHWILCHPADSTLLSVRSRRVSTPGGFEAVVPVTSGGGGSRSGSTSVAGLAPVFILYEINNGARRGRLFLHGVSETDAQDGVMSTGFKTAVNTNMTLCLNNIVLAGGGTPTAVNVIYDRAIKVGFLKEAGRISDLIGTIRRRQLPA